MFEDKFSGTEQKWKDRETHGMKKGTTRGGETQLWFPNLESY